MKHVYLAGPFFSETEVKNIEKAESVLEGRGFDLFSPMRHEGDYEAKMLEFCNNYYGKGGTYVKQVIDELTACTKGHVNLICRMGDTFSIDEQEAEKIDRLWTQAENAEDSSSDAYKAIERSKLSWRYVKAILCRKTTSGLRKTAVTSTVTMSR